MYQDNEDDWQILKEYKQEKRNRVSQEKERARKVGTRATRNKPRAQQELQELQAQKPASKSEKQQLDHKIADKQTLLEAIEHDIDKAEQLQQKYGADIEKLNADIAEIDETIKAIRRKNHEREKASKEGKAEPVQKCPKKCRISDIKISCGHDKHTLDVPPFEKELPTLHVLSGSKSEKQDIVDVTFSGSCDHGKSQSASDSEKHKETNRSHSAEQYCPRVNISNASDGTDVQRPSKTRFLTSTEEFQSNATALGFLFNHLVFNRNKDSSYDAYEYDVSFTSCQGDLPYKAMVVAYPQSSWSLEFNFGYTANYDKHVASRQFAKNGVKDFSALKGNGSWGSSVKANYAYDVYTNEIEQEFNIENLLKELQGSWSVLQKLQEFFDPLGGMVESAIGYTEAEEKKYDNTLQKAKNKDKLQSEHKVASVEVEWPQLKLEGKFQRVEKIGGEGIGGEGELSIGFSPLFGITGKIDIVQLLLQVLGGTFGNFLKKVANMSVGYKNAEGEVDKSRSYIESNIQLFLGATSNVSGSATYKCNAEKGWHADAGGTGISGFLGLILEGAVKVEGKLWVVKVGAGAEFKTTDESGEKPPGIEVAYKPVVIDKEFSWAGYMEFNGLAILWAYYANMGAEGAIEDEKEDEVDESGFGATKVEVEREVKTKGHHVLLKKRQLFGESDVSKIGT